MGKDLATAVFAPEDRVHYRHKVRRCLDALALMLDRGRVRGRQRHDRAGDRAQPGRRRRPAGHAQRRGARAASADPTFQTELGQFNLELNTRPRRISGDGFGAYERDILDSLRRAADRAAQDRQRARADRHAAHPRRRRTWCSPTSRPTSDTACSTTRWWAPAASSSSSTSSGVERLQSASDSIAPEAACTSVQFHLQVPPDRFARYWNASQAIAGVQVAIGANSPYFHGRRLWAETRIALFEQATDTRPDELKAQGVRPRVWFGERWITSVFDLFEENVTVFPAAAADPRGRGPGCACWRRAAYRGSASCGCTTAPSTAGTGRSTT